MSKMSKIITSFSFFDKFQNYTHLFPKGLKLVVKLGNATQFYKIYLLTRTQKVFSKYNICCNQQLPIKQNPS